MSCQEKEVLLPKPIDSFLSVLVAGVVFVAALHAPMCLRAAEVRSLESPTEILTRAFENLYDCDLTMLLEVEINDMRGGVFLRRAKVARKRINGHTHSIARFEDPAWMRGTTMLMVDNTGRSDDHFVYLPESKRTRRMTSVQRSDAFLGSDMWFEDLERRYPEDYVEKRITGGREASSETISVRARPVHATPAYDEIEFKVAKDDYFLLSTAYFRGNSKTPIRTVTSAREHMVESEGHRIPTRYVIDNVLRGTETVATFLRVEVNPVLKDSLFQSVALESGRKIPGLRSR
jgi:hypothetical protein